ncbi:MAG: glycoside hydrolase family 3 C-terminal domain-containing protein, partial [Candidatus Promineifilaceae bacterium]|nr:glycoside hydrolase family 3 C-terminal domain-containing protein [Candidatus Promineifilaceae bacterium]
RLLLDASSLEQKMRWLVEPSANNPTQTNFGGFGVPPYSLPEQVPCTPFVQFTDSPNAVTSRGVTGITAFPAQIALAATWDEDLSRLKGQAHGYEAFYKMNNVLLGPGLASGRVPYLGRNSEYLGEDPLLGGLIAASMVRGLQEDNPEAPVEAVLKHYTANEQELDRRNSSSNMDERTLRQIYTLPYEIAIKEGEPGGVMCAFNQINGDFSCESNLLLNQILKDEIGFKGWVVSDFFGVYDAEKALNAGFDMELVGGRVLNPSTLQALLDSGDITEDIIDQAAFRVVRSHIAVGLFENPLPPERVPDVSTPENQAVAQRVAEEGSVLLKNEGGILPLDSDAIDSIAVIGPTASTVSTNGVNAQTACGTSAPRADCSSIEAPLDGITARAVIDGITVAFDNGSDLGSAADTAANADIAIVFGYYTQGEFADMTDLSLDNDGDALVAAVAAANPNTIVILQTGGPVLMPWIDDVKGILEVWYAGQEMGPAIAALLWGDVNPSGKLPQSFPVSEEDLPTAGSEAQYPGIVVNGIRQVDYAEGMEVGYRWYDAQDIEPLFPFGYGLSYTTFEYSHLQVTPRRVQSEKEIRVKFRVTNTGSVAGAEIAQVYLSLPDGLGEPPKRLVGWEKVTLEPGEHKNITVVVDPTSSAHPLSYWDVNTDSWMTTPGVYTVHVGPSSSADDL